MTLVEDKDYPGVFSIQETDALVFKAFKSNVVYFSAGYHGGEYNIEDIKQILAKMEELNNENISPS